LAGTKSFQDEDEEDDALVSPTPRKNKSFRPAFTANSLTRRPIRRSLLVSS
jgi:hypothetical protein